jgi:orotate phosphoribosyltransferase
MNPDHSSLLTDHRSLLLPGSDSARKRLITAVEVAEALTDLVEKSSRISRRSDYCWLVIPLSNQLSNCFAGVPTSPLKEQLRALLQEKSVCYGQFTLASGAKSDFYVDARVTTLDPRGACLIGEVGWELVKETASKLDRSVNAVGGLTMGADPIALSIGIAAHCEQPSTHLRVFTVRKTVKEHGRQRRIEGNFSPGDSAVIVDDVITTGGSTLQAIDAVEVAGGKIAFVLVLVDREEGGRENIEKLGHRVVPIFTRADLLASDARRESHNAVA